MSSTKECLRVSYRSGYEYRRFIHWQCFLNPTTRHFQLMRLFLLLLIVLAMVSFSSQAKGEPVPSGNQKVVPKTLQAGATFDDRNLPQQTINGWYRIPAWFAGATIRTETVDPSGRVEKSVRQRERGRQVDAKGHIWEASVSPSFMTLIKTKL